MSLSRQNLFTIGPEAPFLATLADRVLDGTLLAGWPRHGPFWLADVTIVLPTRRARFGLAEAFLQRGQRLLPDIRTFGGEAADEEPFLPPLDAPAPPPAAGTVERMLLLSELVSAWAATPAGAEGFPNPPGPAEVLFLAGSLAEIVDDLLIEQVPASALGGIALDRDLAENWQRTLRFLDIALGAWPLLLAERGKRDPAALRNERLRRQAVTAPLIYGDRPVIAAGSTGSIPATADLLKAIAGLERGVIVLPGLDTGLGPAEHDALLDPANAPHGHPQYGLARLVRALGGVISAVTELGPQAAARTRIVRRALVLADETAAWAADRPAPGELDAALAGVTLIAARTEDEEARAIGLAAREALANGRSVQVVTPDRALARRIAAELRRYDIDVDDSAGTPLFQSRAGRLVRQAIAASRSDLAPVDLMALLANPHVRLGFSRAALRPLAEALDFALLRAGRAGIGADGLRRALADNVEGRVRAPRRLDREAGQAAALLLDRLELALAPLAALGERFTATALAEALAASLDALMAAPEGETAPPPLGFDILKAWLADLAALPGRGAMLDGTGLDRSLMALMAGHDVRQPAGHRDDIAIFGPLEARLQSPDLMILAGLNEDVWPRAADPGPWLSRGMRLAAGLEPPERQHGQAAHDFAMALGNEAVVLAWAERRGSGPATPSRLVQRLEAYLGEAATRPLHGRGARWLAAARRLDASPTPPRPALRPAPNPAAALRPRQLSVTEVETLMRSPYDLYARHVLRLLPVDPLGAEADARERGTLVHDIFAAAVEAGHDLAAADAAERLEALARSRFADLDIAPERRDIWLARFLAAADEFLVFERHREAGIDRRHAEVRGEWAFLAGMKLVGRADRLDRLADGSLAILDFKTGSIPRPAVMKAFEAPQLLLEAAMARAGAFAGVPAGRASALTYIKIGLGPEPFTATELKLAEGFTLDTAVDEVVERLIRHARTFLLAATPMPARLHPDLARRYAGAYDHLARTDEWTLAAGEDEEVP